MIDVYVINLKERVDRLEQIKNDFSPYPNIKLNFVEAVRNDNGAIGCCQSHKKCVQYAKDSQMPYIIVLEDDCRPMHDFENRLQEIMTYLTNNQDWDLFLGGVKKCSQVLYKIQLTNNNLYGIKRGHTTHLIIYNQSIYDKVLEIDEINMPIDVFWHKKYRALITVPFIAFQRNGFTDIGKCYNGSFTADLSRTENILNQFISSHQLNTIDGRT